MTNYEVEIIRSKRKSVSLEIKRDFRVILRVPVKMSDIEIERFLFKKRDWLKKNIAALSERLKSESNEEIVTLNEDEIKKLILDSYSVLCPIAEQYAHLMGVEYKKITVRKQKTIWGSCTSKGNLSFNCLLALCPFDVQRYVVIHELCHLKEMNHSSSFWAVIEAYCPDYLIQKQWLKQNGNKLIRRLPK